MLHSEIFHALFITAASLTVVSTILARTHIPTVVAFILTGILIGPSGLCWIKSLPAAQEISELGIVFLMFSLGLEVSLTQLKKIIRSLLTLGFCQVAVTIIIGTLFFIFVLKLNLSQAFVMGACLALSSTAVVLKLLSEKRETETPYGRMSIIILLFQDMAALPLMASLPFLANHSVVTTQSSNLGLTLIGIPIFLLGCTLLGYFIIPIIFHEVTRIKSREVFLFSIFTVTFVISFFAERVGLSISLGAFIAGILISESPFNKQALAEISPFRDIFLGLFFASIGMMADLKFATSNIHHLLWLIPVLFLLKFSVLYSLIKRYSHSHGVSFATSLALSQIGEFSFILAAAAFNYRIIGHDEFQYFLTLAIFSLLITPLLSSLGLRGSAHSSWVELAQGIRLRLKKTHSLTSPSLSSKDEDLRKTCSQLNQDLLVAPRQALVIGLGHAGQQTLIELSKNGIPCIGLDINLANVKQIQKLGIEAIFGDSTSSDILESIGVRNAFLVIITVSGRHVIPKIMATVQHLNPKVKILVRVHYLQEVEELKSVEHCEIVVSESESAKSIGKKALNYYGLS